MRISASTRGSGRCGGYVRGHGVRYGRGGCGRERHRGRGCPRKRSAAREVDPPALCLLRGERSDLMNLA